MPRRTEWPSSRIVFGLLLLIALAVVQAQHAAVHTPATARAALLTAVGQVTVENREFLLNPDERHDATPERTKTQSERVPGSVVFLNSLLMALANGLGVIPFFFVKHLSRETIGMANAVACGVMLACSFDLIHEGEPYGAFLVILGVLLGMLAAKYSQSWLQKYENVKFEALEGADARKILLVLGVMAAHAVGEGAGVGVSYSGRSGWSQGLLVTLAIGLHNIPEGLAVSTVLIARGVAPQRAALWSFLSALPQAMFALPAFLFVETFTRCLPVAVGFAAGCMIWVVFSEFLPDAFDHIPPSKAASAITLSAMWLEGVRMGLDAMESYSTGSVWSRGSLLSQWTLSVISVCICLAARAAIGFKVPVSRFSVDIGVGLQMAFSCALFSRQLFWGSLPLLSGLAWASVGAMTALIDWHARLPTLLLVSIFVLGIVFSSRALQRCDAEHNGCLPQIHRLKSDPTHALFQFLRDPLASKLFMGLMGMGLMHGVRIGSALADASISSTLVPVVLRSAILGAMIGLSLLQSQKNRNSVTLVSGLLVALPAIVSVLAPLLGIHASGPLNRVMAVLSGFLVFNAIKLLFSRIRSIDSSGDLSDLKSISDNEVALDTEEDQLSPNSSSHQGLGIMLGITIASGVLLLGTASHCL